ncbi:MAG: hypothetical protein NTW16_15980, partial [Bacteroidetes bacterium]|nr:hypothetical protein [Bacteroidota bacterium]
WNIADNWTGNAVPAVDANIIFDDVPLNHCQLDQNRSVTNITNTQSTYRMVINGNKLTVKGDLNFSNGAQIDASAASSAIEFAGAMTQSIPLGSFYNNEVYDLIVNNPNHVVLHGTLRLLNTLTTLSGRLNALSGSPTIIYGGATAQTIGDHLFLADSLFNLTIDNTAGVTLTNNFLTTVTGTLTVNDAKKLILAPGRQLSVPGTIVNHAGHTGFVLESDAAGTASLLHQTANVPATVEGNGTGYDLYVWNEPTNCCIYKLNTTAPVNWNTVHPGADFVPGRGYLYSLQATNPTKAFTGILNNGTVSYPLTSAGTDLNLKGFNLVGNPYASSIDWSSATGWGRTSLVNSGGGYDMWIWNPAANNYGVYNSTDGDGVGTNSAQRFLAPMQGYFVRAAGAGNLEMTNEIRVPNSADWFKNTEQHDHRINLCVKSDAGYGFDEIRLDFGYPENEHGARKLFSEVRSAPSLFLSNQDAYLSILYLTDTHENPVVPVCFKAGTEGEYSITCDFDQNSFDILMLEDRQNNYIQNLKTAQTYRFSSSKTDDATRFVLYFGPDTNHTFDQLPGRIYVDGKQLIIDLVLVPEKTEVFIYDLSGRLLLNQPLAGEIRHKLAFFYDTQILIVHLKNEQGSLCRKIFWPGGKSE